MYMFDVYFDFIFGYFHKNQIRLVPGIGCLNYKGLRGSNKGPKMGN